jgi:hypothetical protein
VYLALRLFKALLCHEKTDMDILYYSCAFRNKIFLPHAIILLHQNDLYIRGTMNYKQKAKAKTSPT